MSHRPISQHPPSPDKSAIQRFSATYDAVVRELLTHWNRDLQSLLAAHNVDWSPGRFDFANYLMRSRMRYEHVFHALQLRTNTTSVVDVGGFFGALPVTLQRLGYDVSMTECLRYYGTAFDTLFAWIRSEGVEIIDCDPFLESVPLSGSADFVTLMAVIEHYPHSLSQLMENITTILKPDGQLYLEVPNLAHWPKRERLYQGYSPLPSIASVLHSQVPFTGHHREYTIHDLRELASMTGFAIEDELFYNYSCDPGIPNILVSGVREFLRGMVLAWRYHTYPDTREVLAIRCTKRVRSS